ncbi:MAG: hypothetical protein ISS70_22525 [Phycisphaerae bacterium]|nr:hypothetical protein [Phycisphaerae bacterium]
MGNFSKDPQKVLEEALKKGYYQVRFPQGIPLLDRDVNLAIDLASPQRLAAYHFGNGVPADNDGFRITGLDVAGDNFAIKAGRCLVNGYEVALAKDTTYKAQPHPDNVTNLPAGKSNVYLRVFNSEVTSDQDHDLQNSDDVGVETTVRQKVEWEVLVSTRRIPRPNHFLLAEIDTHAPIPLKAVTDRRRIGLTLAEVKDEIRSARADIDDLGERINTSLTRNGRLRANTVNTVQIADQAVSLAKLRKELVIKGDVTISPNEQVGITLLNGADIRHSHLSISVLITHAVGLPRRRAVTPQVSWSEFHQRTTLPPRPLFTRGVIIKNESPLVVTVEVEAYEWL